MSRKVLGIKAQQPIKLQYTRPFHAAEELYWLAGIIYGLLHETLFVSHLRSQDYVLDTELEDREEPFTEYDKKCMGIGMAGMHHDGSFTIQIPITGLHGAANYTQQ